MLTHIKLTQNQKKSQPFKFMSCTSPLLAPVRFAGRIIILVQLFVIVTDSLARLKLFILAFCSRHKFGAIDCALAYRPKVTFNQCIRYSVKCKRFVRAEPKLHAPYQIGYKRNTEKTDQNSIQFIDNYKSIANAMCRRWMLRASNKQDNKKKTGYDCNKRQSHASF